MPRFVPSRFTCWKSWSSNCDERHCTPFVVFRKFSFFTGMNARTAFPFFALVCLLNLSCTADYFHTANDVYKTRATVYLKNGTQKNGALTIQLENGVEANPTAISLVAAGSQEVEYLEFADIDAYVVNGSTYLPKYVNLYTAGINHGLFVKRLSDSASKMQLFELKQRRKSSDTGEERSLYFISVPSHSATELIELHSTLLVPAFETKMSAFVADCPALATKIKSKENGYFYNFMTPEFKKIEVVKRIIREYEVCTR